MTVSHTFLVSDDLDSFEEYLSSTSQTVLQFGFVWCFPHDWIGVADFWVVGHRRKVPFSLLHIKSAFY